GRRGCVASATFPRFGRDARGTSVRAGPACVPASRGPGFPGSGTPCSSLLLGVWFRSVVGSGALVARSVCGGGRRGDATSVPSSLRVEGGGHRRELLAGENRLDRQPEHLAQAKRQVEAGVVIAPLQRAAGLGVDVDGLGHMRAAEPTFGAKYRQSVVDGPPAAPPC